MDDAGVVALSDDHALVQTIDIFPPVVDDPYWFGRIAAANSLSDIYAMGARPVSAVNFVGYPMDKLGPEPLSAILRGAFDAIEEADCAMAGGHSIKDEEVKFGLAVVGVVHPSKIITNAGARAGDDLVLSKPVGLGYLTTALKQGAVSDEHIDAGQRMMARLNKNAGEAMTQHRVHGATDITGFGLLGHAYEMAKGAGVSIHIDAKAVPVLDAALPYLDDKFTCGGSKRNAAFATDEISMQDSVDERARRLLVDVQTSGGLLMAVDPADTESLLAALHAGGDTYAAKIGSILSSGVPILVS